ncbi:hypothetical protein PHYPO_G00018620 [Pangasianodon hypophthalmus]|uniref:Ig-like domain-containing protein n=1 Tax=Pangasianodon hypophthalmus TaxID=310915 RepID=A0A5N5N5Q5_PANHP|nr:hypothetical protein PHYPO_G00018620 [Pangasianodon hypophthalmus]
MLHPCLQSRNRRWEFLQRNTWCANATESVKKPNYVCKLLPREVPTPPIREGIRVQPFVQISSTPPHYENQPHLPCLTTKAVPVQPSGDFHPHVPPPPRIIDEAPAFTVRPPPTVRIIHSGQACNVEEERYTERVYTIREGETLELACIVSGHPRPQIRWTKTAGSASDRFHESSVFNETLRITHIQRHHGGRYYCKAENGLGAPAIKSIRVDVYYLDDPVVTVHQSVGEAKEQFYYERTVFLRCAANSNPPVRYSWRRGHEFLSQGYDKGVEIYEPFFTQGETKILKLKNLRPQDYANYTCTASVRSVCGIPDKSVLFQLTNTTASPSIKLLVEDPIVANPGQTVTLVCISTGGEPMPVLTWVRHSETLPQNSLLNGRHSYYTCHHHRRYRHLQLCC